MLKIINEGLFSFSTIRMIDPRDGKEYVKIGIYNSNKLQEIAPAIDTGGNIVSRGTILRSTTRELTRVAIQHPKDFTIDKSAITNNFSELVDLELPMSINVRDNGRAGQNVEIRTHSSGEDRANMYLIAFPFNGMIKPIPMSEQYRIYKGFIVSSVKPIFHNNRRYKKVLYLIVEANKNLFNPTHKYHTETIPVELESYAIYKDAESGLEQTNYEKFTLNITSATGEHNIDWNYQVYDKPMYINTERGTPLWTTFRFNVGDKSKSIVKPKTCTKPDMSTPKYNDKDDDYSPRTYKKPKQKSSNQNGTVDNFFGVEQGLYETSSDKRRRNSGGRRNNNKNKYR